MVPGNVFLKGKTHAWRQLPASSISGQKKHGALRFDQQCGLGRTLSKPQLHDRPRM